MTVLGGILATAFAAGRVQNAVAELVSNVKQLSVNIEAGRTDIKELRAASHKDIEALRLDMRTDMRELNQKMDALLLSFLPKPK